MSKTAKPLVISASQIDDFLDCPRRWWFKRVMRLKEVQKNYFTFGTVLHGCIERWMAADEQGRVPAEVPEILAGQQPGAAVEVFPAGWDTIDEKGKKATVTPNEARLIRRLFNEAVEKGIIQRDPRATVERKIDLPVLEGVNLTGFIDIHVSRDVKEIHDHKSFGESSTRYLKQPGPSDEGGGLLPIEEPYEKGDGTSPNSVGHNQQLLTYGAASSRIDDYHGPVLLRHNQFPKFEDPKGVRYVEALVSPGRLEQHWEFIKDTAKEMVKVHKIKKWEDTPPPTSLDACSRYGGCPFRGICGKKESPSVYSERIERQTAKASAPRPNLSVTPRKRKTKTKGDKPMTTDIFARARAAKSGAASAPTPVQAAKAAAKSPPAPAVNSTPAPEVQAEAPEGAAPWGDPACPSCQGYGLNTKGRPCPICDKTAPKRGAPTSAMYTVTLDEDGSVTAVARDAEAVVALGAEEAWVGQVPSAGSKSAAAPKTKTKAKAPKPAPAPEPEPEPQDADEPQEPSAEDLEAQAPEDAKAAVRGPKPARAPKAASSGPGRPRVGVTVLIGAVQLKGPQRPSVTAQEVLETVGAELATEMGAESYWALDPFKRRERIRQRGQAIADSLGKSLVVVPGGNDPDVSSLVNGLIPYADAVYEGLR